MRKKSQKFYDLLYSRWIVIVIGTVFWALLWGGFTPNTVLGGMLISMVVIVLFPQPPLTHELVLRPIPAVKFLAVFIKDLTVSSLIVSWYALRPKSAPGASVIAVPLHSKSDLFLTFTGILATLIPGSVVVEAQRSTGTLFFHAIGAEDREAVEEMRHKVLQQEDRALKAFASRSVLEAAGYQKTPKGWQYVGEGAQA